MRKTIEEIFAEEDIEKLIKLLQVKPFEIKPWPELRKMYNTEEHDILDPTVIPDKIIKNSKGATSKTEPITRIALGLQKLAVERMAEFVFTLPVTLTCDAARKGDEIMQAQFDGIRKALDANKWDSLNQERCEIVNSQCEQATYWYTAKSKSHKKYGFTTDKKLRYQVFCPAEGDELYPYFDDTNDMVAFSRGFSVKDEKDFQIQMFETWTDEFYYRWRQDRENGSKWVSDIKAPIPNPIKKIPISYVWRKKAIFEDADNGKVLEMEKLLSRNGDIIAYHAAPVLLLKGKLVGAPQKSESNKIFETGEGGDAKYVSWEQSPESVKFQFDTLLRMWYMELQLPDLSSEEVKKFGAVSGESRKWALVEPHLKVGRESKIYIDGMEREQSIIKEYLGVMNTAWAGTISDMEIKNKINPFIMSDEKAKVEILKLENGGKPLKSWETSVAEANPDGESGEEWKRLQGEAQTEREADLLISGNSDAP